MNSLIDAALPLERAQFLAERIEVPDWLIEHVAHTTYGFVGPIADAFEGCVRAHLPGAYMWVTAQIDMHRHPFASKLPLLNPSHVILSIVAYFGMMAFCTVLGKALGKRKYTQFGMAHNFLLHVLSLYMFFGLFVSARAAGYSLWNNAAGASAAEWRVAKFIWLFYVSKIPEWLDTALMLLHQNYHQVSFLHVYHHVTIYGIWWVACVCAPAGEAYYSAMVNSGVHVFMYAYYFLTLLFPTGPVRRVITRFKFVITKGQMTQFAFNCLQSLYDLVIVPREQLLYSSSLLQLLFWYMVSLLILFGNFLTSHKSPRAARMLDKRSSHSTKSVSQARSKNSVAKPASQKGMNRNSSGNMKKAPEFASKLSASPIFITRGDVATS